MDLLGPVGAGATWKLINNQLAAGQIAALAEALEVARKAGFKMSKFPNSSWAAPRRARS